MNRIVFISFILLACRFTPLMAQTIVYHEDFKQSEPDWSEYEDLNSHEKMENGKFVMTQKQAKFSYHSTEVALEDGKDYSVETEVTHVSGTEQSAFGLVFAGDGRNNNYVFAILANGRYVLGYWNDGHYKAFIAPTLSEAIKKGNNVSNKLRIETAGDRLKLIINGITVTIANMVQPYGNDVGFIVEKQQTAAFKYLTVTYLHDDDKETVATPANKVVASPPKPIPMPVTAPSAAPAKATVASPPAAPATAANSATATTAGTPLVSPANQPATDAGSVSPADKITVSDVTNIQYAARQKINAFLDLLNFLVATTTEDGSRVESVQKSFTRGNAQQIFENNNVVVEDDTDPESATPSTTKNTQLESYFEELDARYEKTDTPSITFQNIIPSSVKKHGDQIYIRIKFDSRFASIYKDSNVPYKTTQREALMHVDRNDGKWDALIDGISFYTQANPIDSRINDMVIVADTSADSRVLTIEQVNKQIDSTIMARTAAQRQTDTKYNQYISKAREEEAEGEYQAAKGRLLDALKLKPDEVSIDQEIANADRLINEHSFPYLKNKGDELQRERRFKQALDFYKKAQALNLDANLLETAIKPIKAVLDVVNGPQSTLDGKDYDGAIEACKKALKEHKADKANFPELYFIMGQAYEGLYKNKPENPGFKDGQPRNDNLRDALENYNVAITDSKNNYLDALIARANFYVRYGKAYAKAISDYESVIDLVNDENADKPGYYSTEAKWKDGQQNYDDALSLYTKAIELSRKSDSLYFNRGELKYRQKNYPGAKADFDLAIKFNRNNSRAYFYRGLNFAATDNNRLAGKDFAKAQQIGMRNGEAQIIDSLSNVYFRNGEALYDKDDYNGADSSYDIALEITPHNADAEHGKAKIYFSQAQQLVSTGKRDNAKARFKDAIYREGLAISYRADFSDAWFRAGLANANITDYNAAIKSYNGAITADKTNVEAFVELGNTYLITKDNAKALQSYSLAIELLTGNLTAAKKDNDKEKENKLPFELSTVCQLAGKADYLLNDFASAINYLTKALDYNKDNAEALYYRGLANEGLNQESKAIDDYEDALKIWKDYRYYFADGIAQFKSKEYDRAITAYSGGIMIDSSYLQKDRYKLRGLSYFKNKAYDEAVKDYVEYDRIPMAQTDSSFYPNYAYAELYVNMDTLASLHFNKALKLSPNNPQALYGLGCLYAKAGNFDKALGFIERSFATRQIKDDDIKAYEDKFLDGLRGNKPSKTRYKNLKKQYLND